MGFRSYWRKLELYRKFLLSRLSLRATAKQSPGSGEPYQELKEEALFTELRIMLGNLRGEVSSDPSGGVKHLLKMIEEIIRLISRVFHPSFQSLTPCFAGGTISTGSSPRCPPSGAPVSACHCERNEVERSNLIRKEKRDCFSAFALRAAADRNDTGKANWGIYLWSVEDR